MINYNIIQKKEQMAEDDKRAIGRGVLENAVFIQPSAAKVNLVADNGQYLPETVEPMRPCIIPNLPA